MLKLGSVILSLWSLLNLIPSSIIFIYTIFFGNAPVLSSLSNEETNALSPELVTMVNSIAVYANGTNIAFCFLSIFVIWMGLNQRTSWTFWVLLIGYIFALIAGISSDYVAGSPYPWINVISAIILAVGFTFSAIGLFRNNKHKPHAVT